MTPTGSPVVAIRAFDDNGFTSTYTLMRGIDHAIQNGARVLSLSWGSETPSALLSSAVGYAAAKGLILVAAAGNAPTGNPVYPAAYDNVIGVGALNPNGMHGISPTSAISWLCPPRAWPTCRWDTRGSGHLCRHFHRHRLHRPPRGGHFKPEPQCRSGNHFENSR
jgi:hypothetical protein